jgi:formylglycine-generating enzyme required for sulfatase activity
MKETFEPSPDTPEGMLYIPGGTFRMGSETGYEEEQPVHHAEVGPFFLDATPITNAQYRRFCNETERGYPESPRWPDCPESFIRLSDHPVVNVGYDDAVAYAAWCGKRLPTEAEWEFAARGGQDGRFPWGDEAPDGSQAVFATRSTPVAWRDPLHSDGFRRTAPVASFPPNAYGLYDMAGNVWEWCDNWFYRYPWEDLDAAQIGEGWGLQRVVRGGSWYSPPRDLRVTRRLRVHAGTGGNGNGFRCAQDVPGLPGLQTAPVLVAPIMADPAAFDAAVLAHPRRMERGVELCLGCGPDLTDDEAARIAALGFTSVEQYVHWATVENEDEGVFDFSHWDSQIDILESHGLKWVPFLIAGPAYSIPDWFREGPDHHGAVCLEHRLPSKIQSIFDRTFDRHIERYLTAFADQYRERGVIEALLLGITGDFGEAIYPVTGTMWTQVTPGPYHTHAGYWCGDSVAERNFRQAMLERYGGDLGPLNAAWGTTFVQPSEVVLPELHIPTGIEGFRADERTPPGGFDVSTPRQRRRWLDFIDWYRGAMNDLATTWMTITRTVFPDHPIYLCTGGDAPPEQGAHFGDQCRIAASVGGGVRITNEASNYPRNFAITRWVTSAGRFHGAYTGIEPAGGVNEFGVTGRIFNAVASGAKNLHFYAPNIVHHRETIDAWNAGYEQIRLESPVLDVAFFHPDTSIMLGLVPTAAVFQQVANLRDLTDIDYVDDEMVASDVLDRFRILVMTHAFVVEQQTLARIDAWLSGGGVLVLLGEAGTNSVEGDAWTPVGRVIRTDLFGDDPVRNEAIAAAIVTGLDSHGYGLLDGVLDNVFVSQVEGRLLVLNHGSEDIIRELSLPGGEIANVNLPANTIVQVPLS